MYFARNVFTHVAGSFTLLSRCIGTWIPILFLHIALRLFYIAAAGQRAGIFSCYKVLKKKRSEILSIYSINQDKQKNLNQYKSAVLEIEIYFTLQL